MKGVGAIVWTHIASSRPGYGTGTMASIQQFPIAHLSDQGLVLQAAFRLELLARDLVVPLIEAGIDLESFQTLVLMGQGGTSFFDNALNQSLDGSAPFDEKASGLISEWFETNAPTARFELVYPGPAGLPLGRLAELGGWGSPSPLGLTINATYGPWIAHRVGFVTDLEWDYRPPAVDHPCDSCESRPCESACPVGAVSFLEGFRVRSCSEHRAAPRSECAFQCLARNACPVGAEHRYANAQMRHHYGAGLASLKAWLAQE